MMRRRVGWSHVAPFYLLSLHLTSKLESNLGLPGPSQIVDDTIHNMTEPVNTAQADDAAAQDAPPRVIDENTDMSTLTDQEIMRLMEGMDHNEDVMSKVRSVVIDRTRVGAGDVADTFSR